ncbi:DUF4915 domain-containing protein [Marinicella sp. W31]|uniref:DUF4915 domain-containing protein n=1 Tax=Marinicella sp. W31 TaxID=3023713 RepID=UPI0037566763
MNSKYLISFCNNKTNINPTEGTGYLGMLTVSDDEMHYAPVQLNLPHGLQGNGITGLCAYTDGYLAILQRPTSTLLFLNTDFSVREVFPLEGLSGVHSVCHDGQSIYCAVTSQDRIVRLDENRLQSDAWSSGAGQDTVHLNSICLHQKHLLATCFGLKASSLWRSATEGIAFDATNGENIMQDLWHPHSIVVFADDILCCDSSRQRVVSQKQGVVVSDVPGYARGLFINQEMLLCGTSKGRLVSHSTGVVIGNKSDQGDIGGSCGVSLFTHRAATYQSTEYIALDDYAEEIYDIIPLT